MKSIRLKAQYVFHPVGQGLFASGSLSTLPPKSPKYHWVYDCGSVSGKLLVERELTRLERLMAEPRLPSSRQVIDLVVISHFDADHISGMVELLKLFDVRDLLLPYVPLHMRLILSFEERSSTDSMLTQFLLSPVAFVRGLPGANVERVLFANSGGEGPRVVLDGGVTPLCRLLNFRSVVPIRHA